MAPKVSIVVPVYNVEDYVSNCIKSILQQTFRNYELIVVNDGSTDNSLSELQNFSDSRLKIFSQENRGLSGARNTGIKHAKGKYITFIDSDDWISKDYLETMMYYADKYNADIVSIKECVVDYHNSFYCKKRKFRVFNQNAANALFSFFDTNFAWGKLIKREIISKHNIYFPEGRNYEDIGTMYRIYYFANIVVISNKANYFYREREGSITFTRKTKDIDDKIHFIKEMNKKEELFNKYEYWDLYVLIKIFGAISDVYKVKNISDNQKRKYIKVLYSLSKKHKLKLRYFKITNSIFRAILIKLKLAHVALDIKHRKRELSNYDNWCM